MNQKQQMEKITFCLLNSGDGNMEDLALHLFRSGKNSARGSINNETFKGEIPNKTAILQAVGQDTIPEVNEGGNESMKKDSKIVSQRRSLKSSKFK